jgi:MoxR-like ATPase
MESGLTTSLFSPATATAGDAFTTVDELERGLRDQRYVAERGLATTLFLTLKLGKPLLLEGEAGVGKTEIAKVLADVLQTPLIRLQCYEGLDAATAIYEWDYPRQMLYLRTVEATGGESRQAVRHDLFSEEFLLKRPLLQAIDAAHERAPVLLIDEVDRADQELEAFLLELLSDFQVTVPEIGTIRAEHVPVVILTSNRTRDLHEALRRRCVYHWIDYPDPAREAQIIMIRASGVAEATAKAVVNAVGSLRREPLTKPPGVAESVDWAEAVTLLAKGGAPWPEAFKRSIGVAVKDEEDLIHLAPRLDRMLVEALA